MSIISSAQSVHEISSELLNHESDPDSLYENETFLNSMLSVISMVMKNYYRKKFSWTSSVNWLKDESIFSFNFGNGRKLADILHNPKFTHTLIQGEPSFGKSALCALVTKKWCVDELKGYDLCIHVNLSDITENISLEEILVSHVTLVSKLYDKEALRALLKYASKRVLIICDGLDQLQFHDRHNFLQSFSELSFLHSSKVIMTSRPMSTDIPESFWIFDIGGFEYNYLKHLAVANSHMFHDPAAHFDECWKNSKAFYFTGFSPMYMYYVYQVYIKETPNKITLYKLLRKIMSKIIEEYDELLNDMSVFCSLGRLCLKILQNNAEVIDENSIQSEVGDLLTIAINVGMVNMLPCEQKYTWNKLFVVFLAVYFLNNKLAGAKNPVRVVNKYFCPKDTTADLAISYSVNGKINRYLIGIYPEIALRVVSGQYRQFAMCHDLNSKIEVSNALNFDSVNLLLQINQKYLSHLGFHELDNDVQIQDLFMDVINSLECNSKVNLKCFCNKYEDKFYTAWTVEDSDEDCFLRGIAMKTNEQLARVSQMGYKYDQLHLNFLISKNKKYIEMLQKLLDIKLTDIANRHFATNLINQIWTDIVNKKEDFMVCVCIYDSVTDETQHILNEQPNSLCFNFTHKKVSIVHAPFTNFKNWNDFESKIIEQIGRYQKPLMVVDLKYKVKVEMAETVVLVK